MRQVVGLIVVGLLFVPIERLWPLRRQPVLRPRWRTDVVHFLVDRVLSTVAIVAAVVTVGVAARVATPVFLREMLTGAPLGVRLAVAIVVAEIAQYWAHRAAHEVPFLWRFHKVHHSTEQLDWLAAARLHPLDQAFTRGAAVVPLFALGYQDRVIGALAIVFALQAIFVHANVRWTFGPLRYVVATPQFHHWHHAGEPEHRNRNYAGELPLLDALFGSLHLPAREWPSRYGIDEPTPDGYLRQIAWPFRDPQPAVAANDRRLVATHGGDQP